MQTAAEFFFNKGVTITSPQMIAKELDISTGNITYYFHTKEHLLAVFVEMLCNYQWNLIEVEVEEGYSSVMAICLELAAMASVCEENEVARDFYQSTYTSDLCLEIIQKNDIIRAKRVFGEYCKNWTDEEYAVAENIASGVEYTALKNNATSPKLDKKISGALETILTTYNVPVEIRKKTIEKVLNMDYRMLGRRVFGEFKEYVKRKNDEFFEDLIAQIRR